MEYVTKKQLLNEIEQSKLSFCWFRHKKYTKYDEFFNDLDEIDSPKEGFVYRVFCAKHIPEMAYRRATKSNPNPDKINFRPFKHYLYENGEFEEVLRSHWTGSLKNGKYSNGRGNLTPALGKYILQMVHGVGLKGNYSGYTYLDDMKSNAIMQLTKNGLKFDESSGKSPFAYYTTIINNAFIFVLNQEKQIQRLRDDIAIENGARPSFTRTLEEEWK